MRNGGQAEALSLRTLGPLSPDYGLGFRAPPFDTPRGRVLINAAGGAGGNEDRAASHSTSEEWS